MKLNIHIYRFLPLDTLVERGRQEPILHTAHQLVSLLRQAQGQDLKKV